MSVYKGTTLLAGLATNTIENAHSLFDFKWTDHKLNEMSWLRADTYSWQSGDVYVAAYNHLAADLSNATETQEYRLFNWTQPVLTASTTSTPLGDVIVTTSNEYSTYNGWKAMDGVKSGTTATTGWGTNNSSATQWWQVKFPYLICITGLKGYQRYDNTPANANTVGQFYTSSEKTVTIGNQYNNATGTNWNAVTVTGIPKEGIVTDTIFFEKTGGGNYGGLGELEITAKRAEPFTVYIAPDGHKITSNEQMIADIYNEKGVAWYYVLDTENTRFKLPRTKYGFAGLRDEVGKYVSESLPDHQHTIGLKSRTDLGNGGKTATIFDSGSTAYTTFASESNSTYQTDAPVQQRATQMYLYFYVGQFSQSATEQTAGITTTQLNEKVDLDAQNLSAQGRSLVGVLGFPSTRYEDLTLGASGTEYEAPANGWFAVSKASGATQKYIALSCGYLQIQSHSSGNDYLVLYIPAKKGDIATVSYNATGSTNWFRFIYSESEDVQSS